MLTDTQQMNHVRRVIDDIRAGYPVKFKGNNHYILSIESVSRETFELLKTSDASLVLSVNRAKWLGQESAIAIKLGDVDSYECLQQLAGLLYEDGVRLPKFEATEESVIVKLMTEADCMPAYVQFNEQVDKAFEISADEVNAYLERDLELQQLSKAPLKLHYAKDAHIYSFKVNGGHKEHYAICVGNPDANSHIPIRIHSSSFINDLLLSLKSDCRSQLDYAIQYLSENGGGIVLYLMQEGRGIGLPNVLRAYELQDEHGLDTVDANRYLGFADDERSFELAAAMLRDLGFKKVDVLSNNPKKLEGLRELGIDVGTNIPVVIEATEDNQTYLNTKQNRLGHK